VGNSFVEIKKKKMSVVIAANACLNKPINPDHIPFLKNSQITGIYAWGFHNNDSPFIPIYIGHNNRIFEGIFNSVASFRGGVYKIPAWVQLQCFQNPTADYSSLTCLDDMLCFNNTNNSAKRTAEYIIENFKFIYLELDDSHAEAGKRYLTSRVGRDRIINQVIEYHNELPENITTEIDSIFGFCYNPSF